MLSRQIKKLVNFTVLFLLATSIATVLLLSAAFVVEVFRPEEPFDLFLIDGRTVYHRCDIPVIYAYSENATKYLKDQTENAIKYWNSVYGGDLFVGIGTIDFTYKDPLIGDLVLIDVVPKEEYKEAFDKQDLARVQYYKNPLRPGCIGGNIIVKQYLTEKKGSSNAGLENIMRHELGHILGLQHSKNKKALMYPSTDPKRLRRQKITKIELQAFKLLYSK